MGYESFWGEKMFKDIPDMNLGEIFRFLSYCSEPDENGCVFWMGAKDTNGYGAFNYCGKKWKPHRISYFLYNGYLESNLIIRHRCPVAPPNKLCVCPLHLTTGNYTDNARDLVADGYSKNQKLTFKDANDIRLKYKAGIKVDELITEYNVSKSCINQVLWNKSFSIDGYEWKRKLRKQKTGGVAFCKEKQKWAASVKCNYISKHLGYYDTYEEADLFIKKYKSGCLSYDNKIRKSGTGSISFKTRNNKFEVRYNDNYQKQFNTLEEAEQYLEDILNGTISPKIPKKIRKSGTGGISYLEKWGKYQVTYKKQHIGFFRTKIEAEQALQSFQQSQNFGV
jgi:hypothetical protein